MKRNKLSGKWKLTGAALAVLAGIQLLTGSFAVEQVYGASGPVTIDETNFPDEVFRNYVIENFSSNGNTLSEAECEAVIVIEVPDSGITDLKGIEYFPKLKLLYCNENDLTSLDVSQNQKLETLNCSGNALNSLNVSAHADLSYLDCSENNLVSLDISANRALKLLNCNNNSITSLDISGNTDLYSIDCSYNQLSLLDVSSNTALESLLCSKNDLGSIDVSANTALRSLACYGIGLESLDVSKNTNLTTLLCGFNNLDQLDISHNSALIHLDCNQNVLTSLDLSANAALKKLWCGNNELENLDVSHNPALEQLWCEENKLCSLDLSGNPNINSLICSDNIINVSVYQEGDYQYIDLTGLPLDKSRVSSMGGGRFDTETGRLELANRVMVGDRVLYQYATGQDNLSMTVLLQVTEVIEKESASTDAVGEIASTSEAVATTAGGTTLGAVSQKSDSPKTGDSISLIWIFALCLLSASGSILVLSSNNSKKQ